MFIYVGNITAAGVARNVDIGKALSIIQKQYKLLTRELRKNVSLAGIAARPKRKVTAFHRLRGRLT